MLKIDMMPIKGILFVRLSGKLVKQSIKSLNNEVLNFQKKIGIKNLVFNLDNLTDIDNYGKYALIDSFNLCKFNHGQSFICLGNNKKILNKIKENFNEKYLVKDELTATNLINS